MSPKDLSSVPPINLKQNISHPRRTTGFDTRLRETTWASRGSNDKWRASQRSSTKVCVREMLPHTASVKHDKKMSPGCYGWLASAEPVWPEITWDRSTAMHVNYISSQQNTIKSLLWNIKAAMRVLSSKEPDKRQERTLLDCDVYNFKMWRH